MGPFLDSQKPLRLAESYGSRPMICPPELRFLTLPLYSENTPLTASCLIAFFTGAKATGVLHIQSRCPNVLPTNIHVLRPDHVLDHVN